MYADCSSGFESSMNSSASSASTLRFDFTPVGIGYTREILLQQTTMSTNYAALLAGHKKKPLLVDEVDDRFADENL